HPFMTRFNPVVISSVIKSRLAEHAKRQTATHHTDPTNQLVLAMPAVRFVYWHEIGDFAHAVGGEKARDENVCIRPVHLLVSRIFRQRADLETPTFLVVKEGTKHTGRVETRKTEPIDRTIRAH